MFVLQMIQINDPKILEKSGKIITLNSTTPKTVFWFISLWSFFNIRVSQSYDHAVYTILFPSSLNFTLKLWILELQT